MSESIEFITTEEKFGERMASLSRSFGTLFTRDMPETPTEFPVLFRWEYNEPYCGPDSFWWSMITRSDFDDPHHADVDAVF